MKPKLTARQELFCQHYALTGNGTDAAMKAGCRARKSANVRAVRWIAKASIQGRIKELREKFFSELRHHVSETLCRSIIAGMESGLHCAEGRRAIAYMNRLGVFDYLNALRDARSQREGVV